MTFLKRLDNACGSCYAQCTRPDQYFVYRFIWSYLAPTLYASITIAMAAAAMILSPNGTIGSQALRRAAECADSSAFGRTYIAEDRARQLADM